MLDAATGIHGHGHADPNASIDVVAGSFFVLGVDPARLVAGRAPDTRHRAVFLVSAQPASESIECPRLPISDHADDPRSPVSVVGLGPANAHVRDARQHGPNLPDRGVHDDRLAAALWFRASRRSYALAPTGPNRRYRVVATTPSTID
jgi:hypothetical protein